MGLGYVIRITSGWRPHLTIHGITATVSVSNGLDAFTYTLILPDVGTLSLGRSPLNQMSTMNGEQTSERMRQESHNGALYGGPRSFVALFCLVACYILRQRCMIKVKLLSLFAACGCRLYCVSASG
jgi:hypothetical protein